MKCADFRPFIDAYIDGELDDRDSGELEAHLSDCDQCRQIVEHQSALKDAVSRCLSDSERQAPSELRDRIEDAVRSEADASAGWLQRAANRNRWQWVAAGLPMVAGVAMMVWLMSAMTVAPAASGQVPAVEQTVNWHKANYPVEVRGPGAKQVTNWFRGKVDFPVRLPSFQGKDVTLVGGRIAQIQNHHAAYVAYDIDGSRVSVMVFHGGKDLKVPKSQIRKVGDRHVALMNSNGYEVAMIQDAGLTYTLTSDLAESALLEVVRSSFQAASAE
jgi:anti-sigma factor RsiW